MKIPLKPAGIKPAYFRFVAQHLNHCATAVPMTLVLAAINIGPGSIYSQGKVIYIMNNGGSRIDPWGNSTLQCTPVREKFLCCNKWSNVLNPPSTSSLHQIKILFSFSHLLLRSHNLLLLMNFSQILAPEFATLLKLLCLIIGLFPQAVLRVVANTNSDRSVVTGTSYWNFGGGVECCWGSSFPADLNGRIPWRSNFIVFFKKHLLHKQYIQCKG